MKFNDKTTRYPKGPKTQVISGKDTVRIKNLQVKTGSYPFSVQFEQLGSSLNKHPTTTMLQNPIMKKFIPTFLEFLSVVSR